MHELATKQTRPLIPPSTPPVTAYAAWSPTGESIAFVAENDLYVLPSPSYALPLPLTPSEEFAHGHIATSSVGEAGQRQTREQAAQEGIEPLARIDSRIQNRVQSRLRNRIDRDYDPQANAASPFEVAGEKALTAGRPRPR